jgi:hypothetical protein
MMIASSINEYKKEKEKEDREIKLREHDDLGCLSVDRLFTLLSAK